MIIFSAILPFNICFVLPQIVFGLSIYDSFKYGVPSNYYRIVFSALDLVVLFMLPSIVAFYRKYKRWLYFLLPFFSILLNLLIYKDIVILVKQVQFYAYILTAISFVEGINNVKSQIWVVITNILIVNLVVQCIIMIIQVATGSSIDLNFLGESELIAGYYGSSSIVHNGNIYLRGYGTFAHPNIAGAYIVFAIIMLIELAKLNSWKKALVLCFGTIAIFLTFSRMAIFVLGAFFAVKIVQYFYRHREVKISSFILVERVGEIFNTMSTTVRERIELTKRAINYIMGQPVLGVGYGRFVSHMGQNQDIIISEGRGLFEPVHNIFLLFLSENGLIIGLISIIALLILIFQAQKKCFSKRKNRVLFGILIVWVIVFGGFDHFLITLHQGIAAFGCFIAVMIYLAHETIHKNLDPSISVSQR